jgi:hypothetical protein
MLKLLLNRPFFRRIAKGYTSFRPYEQRLNYFVLSLSLHQNPLILIFYIKKK